MQTLIFTARIVAEVSDEMAEQYTAHLFRDMIGLDTRGCPGFEVAAIAVDRKPLIEDGKCANVCTNCFGDVRLPYIFPADNGDCHGTERCFIGA